MHHGPGTAWDGSPCGVALRASPEQDELGATGSLHDGEGGGQLVCLHEFVERADSDDGRKAGKTEK